MDPRDLHRETVRLVKVMQNVKDSGMGISIKRSEIKKLKNELLLQWVNNKEMIPMTNIPSKNIVMTIAHGFDKKYKTNYIEQLFTNYTEREYCASEISDYSEVTSEVYSECLTDTLTELTV